MKYKILILFLICFYKNYSQKIEKRVGDVHVISEEYYFEGHKKSKKLKINETEYYFNDKGQILETITHGTNHINNLNIIGRIEQFFYHNDMMDLSKSYMIDCNNSEYDVHYRKYLYDENNNLISSNSYNEANDSLIMPITYIYKDHSEEKHFGELTYYEKKTDSINQIVELNQRYEDTNAIRWQYLYKYLSNSTITIFQTYYNDNMDRTEVEIKTYDIEKRLISYEKIGVRKTKQDYNYSKDGFLSKITEYSLNVDGVYELERITKFKVKKNQKYLKPVYLQKIHSELIEEE